MCMLNKHEVQAMLDLMKEAEENDDVFEDEVEEED